MSLRRQFIVVLVAFALALTGVGAWGAWSITRPALESEMDDKLRQVVGAAAEVGFERSGLGALRPGEEDSRLWTGAHNRLRQLGDYVAEAWILRASDMTAVATSHPADSLPLGAPLPQFEAFRPEIQQAQALGTAVTSTLFQGSDGRFYKYGFAALQADPGLVLAVRMRADYLDPLGRFRQRILLGTLGAAVLAGLLAVVLARGVANPLERLSRVALRIQRGHWDVPVEPEAGMELGRLSRAMERMRQGILSREDQLRLMLAQVAHEIRNPLGGLELFTAAAAEADDPAERARMLERVRAEVRALNQIINDFLAFARPLEPEVHLHDVRAPVREAVDLADAHGGGDGGGRIRVELPDEPVVARADPDHVKRITLNLLRNALDVAEHATVSVGSERGEVVIRVQDDGPGVPEALRERVFEPFVTDKEQGAGLGLAIVRKLAEANGGRVELGGGRPEEHRWGAEFAVYLKSSDELPLEAESLATSTPQSIS